MKKNLTIWFVCVWMGIQLSDPGSPSYAFFFLLLGLQAFQYLIRLYRHVASLPSFRASNCVTLSMPTSDPVDVEARPGPRAARHRRFTVIGRRRPRWSGEPAGVHDLCLCDLASLVERAGKRRYTLLFGSASLTFRAYPLIFYSTFSCLSPSF